MSRRYHRWPRSNEPVLPIVNDVTRSGAALPVVVGVVAVVLLITPLIPGGALSILISRRLLTGLVGLTWHVWRLDADLLRTS